MRKWPVLLLLASIAALAQTAPAPSKRPFTFEDMMALKRVSDPVISPDGHWVMFSAVDVDLKENTRKPHLWVVPLQGGKPSQVTSSPAGETRGRFSPDGKRILFISTRDGSSQVWLQDFDSVHGQLSGEPQKLTSISTEADGALWSPDGRYVVFVSQVYPDCPPSDDACNKQRDEDRAQSKVKANIFTRLYYRHWSSFTRFKRSHLFSIPVEGGKPTDITPGDHDVPPFNLGGQDYYSISPDGKEVAYTSNISEVEATSTNNEIFVVPIAGGTPRKISTSPGSDSTPLYSPDGKYIAYRMQVRGGYESDRFRLVLYERSSGKIKNLTEDWDHWVETIAWTPDSKQIYFTSEDKGEAPIYRIGVDGGDVKEVVRGFNDELSFSPDGRVLVFSRMSIKFPAEVFRLALSEQGKPAGEAQNISRLNEAVLSKIEMQDLESFWFTGAEKTKVQGFLLKPPGFDPGKKYPVKFAIHGGPQGAWGDDWSYRWNMELFAADGYVVVMINPRGSVGYGQKFIDQINGDWGGRPYVDLMNGLDYVEATYPYVQKGNVCALGASYGGYMVNWIITHNTRFKCAVSHDGMFNPVSAWGTTEELFFNEWEFRGTPWTSRRIYEKWSPEEFSANIKTPTFVIHGQLDYRLDVSEGFQLFNTLQRLGVPSKMLYFPDEGHWVLKPQNSELWYKSVNAWVDQWLKPESRPQPVAGPTASTGLR